MEQKPTGVWGLWEKEGGPGSGQRRGPGQANERQGGNEAATLLPWEWLDLGRVSATSS